MNIQTALIIFLNLAFLARYAVYDIKTHSIPRIATLAFVIFSLLLTNLSFFIQAILVCIIMYLITRTVVMGTGDRKIIFGLTLQYGGMLGFILLGTVVLILYLRGRNKKPLPLIPVIFVVYIFWLINLVIKGTLT
jgi:hypothetical protein